MTDETLIGIQQNIIGLESNVNNIQDTVNKIQQYINSLHGDDFDIFGDYSQIIYSASYLTFPNIGDIKNIYVDTTMDLIYRWNDRQLKYYMLGRDYNDIKIIDGGTSLV